MRTRSDTKSLPLASRTSKHPFRGCIGARKISVGFIKCAQYRSGAAEERTLTGLTLTTKSGLEAFRSVTSLVALVLNAPQLLLRKITPGSDRCMLGVTWLTE